MFLFCLVFALPLCASVYMCFVVTCWERADLLALVCGVYYEFVTCPLVSWVNVWYLIVSIPDLCTLTYFKTIQFCSSALPLFLFFSLNICLGTQVKPLTVHIASFWEKK